MAWTTKNKSTIHNHPKRTPNKGNQTWIYKQTKLILTQGGKIKPRKSILTHSKGGNSIQPNQFEFQGEWLQVTPPNSSSCVDTSSMKRTQN